jgi:hypothetical protein
MALPPNYAKLAVAELAAQQIAILGGDIWSTGPIPRPTYRNWNIDRASDEDWKHYVERSRQLASDQIDVSAVAGETLIVLVSANEAEYNELP